MHYTVPLQSTLYHKDHSSVSKNAAQEENLREKLNGDLQGNYSSGKKYVSFIYLNL